MKVKSVKKVKKKNRYKKRSEVKKVKVIPLKTLREELDRVFSIYIRQRDCIESRGNFGPCYTCGKIYSFKDLQCGHFVSRSAIPTRYDEQNCHAQCVGCNIFKSGNMVNYANNMIEQYGSDILRLLLNKSRLVDSMSRAIYLELIQYYKEKTSKKNEDHEANQI